MSSLRYIFCFLMGISFVYAQDEKSNADVKTIVESASFEFVAESALPMRGRSIILSSGYTFTVLPDTIESYLPYFGRAYQATIDPSKAGIKFTSTDFDYALKERKKGWDITVKPKDVNNSPQINLSVSPNGYALIRFTFTDRQSISFRGFVKAAR